LFVAEFAIREDDFDIEEDDREASDPVPTTESALLKRGQGSVLVRNSLKLARRVDEVLPDLIGKLDYGDEVAHTKTEAHRNSSTALLLAHQKKVRESGMRKRQRMEEDCLADRFVYTQPHDAEFHPLGRLGLDALLAVWAS
jgi:hypothetical protein